MSSLLSTSLLVVSFWSVTPLVPHFLVSIKGMPLILRRIWEDKLELCALQCFKTQLTFTVFFRSFNGHSGILQIWKSVQLSQRKTRRFHCIQGRKMRLLSVTRWGINNHWLDLLCTGTKAAGYFYGHFIFSPHFNLYRQEKGFFPPAGSHCYLLLAPPKEWVAGAQTLQCTWERGDYSWDPSQHKGGSKVVVKSWH